MLKRLVANRLAEQILSGFASDGDTVFIDAAPGGGVTLETVPAGSPLPEARPAGPDDGIETARSTLATAGEA